MIAAQAPFAVFPMVGADHCARLIGLPFQRVATDGTALARALEHGYRAYGYDMVLVFSDPYVEAQALGCPVRLDSHPTLMGPRSGDSLDRTGEIVLAAALLRDGVDVPVFVSIKGPFSLAAFLVGIEEFLRLLITDLPAADRFVAEALRFQLSYLERIAAVGAHVLIGDPVASASVVSPGVFCGVALEPLRRMVEAARAKGCLVGVHICGDTGPIMGPLDDLAVDFLSIEDIARPTRTLKMGGVATHTIFMGDPRAIEQEIRVAASQPRLIFSTACDVPAETDPESIRTMVTSAHGYCNR